MKSVQTRAKLEPASTWGNSLWRARVYLWVYLLLGEVPRVLGLSEFLSEFSEDLRVLDVLLLELLDLSVQEKVPLGPAFCVGGVVQSRGAQFPL